MYLTYADKFIRCRNFFLKLRAYFIYDEIVLKKSTKVCYLFRIESKKKLWVKSYRLIEVLKTEIVFHPNFVGIIDEFVVDNYKLLFFTVFFVTYNHWCEVSNFSN